MEVIIAGFTLFGVIIGIFGTLYVQFLNEKSKYKEIIFREKTVFFKEINEAISNIYSSLSHIEKDARIIEMKIRIRELYAILMKHSAITSTKLLGACNSFAGEIANIENFDEIKDYLTKTNFIVFLTAVEREELGTEKLSDETQDIFNKFKIF